MRVATCTQHDEFRFMGVRRAVATLASIGLIGASIGCASSSDPPTRAAPTRSVMRIGNEAPIEMYTEPGRGESVVLAPSPDVWKVLSDVFEQLEIPVTRSDPRVPEIGNLGYPARRIEGKRMGTYIDCGTNLGGQLANSYEITLSVMTRLTDGPTGTTVVTTIVDANGVPRATSGNQVHCQSREVLERRVAEIIAEKLGVGVG